MELILHAGRFGEALREGVDDGLAFQAQIKRDEVSLAIVTRATTHGNGRICRFPGWGKVASVVPSCGCLPYTKDLVYLMLLKQRDGRAELE